jgi:hypothetical protein
VDRREKCRQRRHDLGIEVCVPKSCSRRARVGDDAARALDQRRSDATAARGCGRASSAYHEQRDAAIIVSMVASSPGGAELFVHASGRLQTGVRPTCSLYCRNDHRLRCCGGR